MSELGYPCVARPLLRTMLKGLSGGMRSQLLTAYLRCVGYLHHHHTGVDTPVGAEAVKPGGLEVVWVMVCGFRQVAETDRHREQAKALRKTVEVLTVEGHWLERATRSRLQQQLNTRLVYHEDHPPGTRSEALAFQDDMQTWCVTCPNHPAPRQQVEPPYLPFFLL